MREDGMGLPIGTERPETIAAIDRIRESLLGCRRGLDALFPAAADDPDCAYVQALCAAIMMLMESADGQRKARHFLDRARTAPRPEPREGAFIDAVAAWVEGHPATAASGFDQMAVLWPRDLISVKIGQYLHFNTGNADGILDLGRRAVAAAPEVGYVWGMRAFGQEQCHDLDGAERSARHAVDMARDDPWAHHAVAHVMETRSRVDEGIAWMEGHADCWASCSSFMLTHNWWHTALFRLDRDEFDAVLDLYDRQIWGVWKAYSQDQVNAVSLLTRLELRGVDVGDRWQDVGLHLARRECDHINPFLDMHYVYGLAKANHAAEIEAWDTSLSARAEAANGHNGDVWARVALPLARAMIAHAAGNWSEAADRLDPLLPQLHTVGGSHAQRDLFSQIHLDAVIRAGRRRQAQTMARERRAERPAIGHLGRLVDTLAA